MVYAILFRVKLTIMHPNNPKNTILFYYNKVHILYAFHPPYIAPHHRPSTAPCMRTNSNPRLRQRQRLSINRSTLASFVEIYRPIVVLVYRLNHRHGWFPSLQVASRPGVSPRSQILGGILLAANGLDITTCLTLCKSIRPAVITDISLNSLGTADLDAITGWLWVLGLGGRLALA